MKKKNLLALTLVAVLAFTLGMGTLAYYSKTFTSNDNVVRAARFDVDTNGTLDKDHTFDLDNDPMYPGRNMDVYNFEIHKNRTEVPVEYRVSAHGSGGLFYGNSPVEVNLMRKVGGKWEKFNGPILSNPEAKEEFKINLTWDHTNHDIDYQGKTGKINMKVVATQVDGEVEEPEPEFEVVSDYFTWGATTYIYVKDIKGLEGAANYTVPYGEKGTIGGIKPIGKAVSAGPRNTNLKSFNLRIYDENYGRIWEGVINNPNYLGEKNPDPFL